MCACARVCVLLQPCILLPLLLLQWSYFSRWTCEFSRLAGPSSEFRRVTGLFVVVCRMVWMLVLNHRVVLSEMLKYSLISSFHERRAGKLLVSLTCCCSLGRYLNFFQAALQFIFFMYLITLLHLFLSLRPLLH